MEIPQELRLAIEKQLEGNKTSAIIENSQIISKRYRQNTDGTKKLLTEQEEAVAYSISRMPATYCAVYSVFQHILEINNGKISSLLDVGAGTGSATWAINELIDLDKITCLEREKVMINTGKELMKNTELKDIEWKECDILKDDIKEKADIVVTSYMINELSEKENAILKLWEATEKILVIIEPGTPAGYKNIIEAREILLKQGAKIIAPCSHQGKCGLPKDDWCSFYVRVARSGIQRLSKKGELGYEDEKFSYIAFSKTQENNGKERILRHPQIKQGHIKIKLCTPNGIEQRTITKKDGQIYKKVKKLDAGDILK